MNKSESKYFNTAVKMNEAFLCLLEKKDFEYITVKEICEKAKVNRSTFYLHYETIVDLLDETSEYVNRKFLSYFKSVGLNSLDVDNSENHELDLITPTHLTPWLTFIKENKKLFQTLINKHATFNNSLYKDIGERIIYPILERLIPNKEDRRYVFLFNVEGIIAIVKEWLRNNCNRDISDIVGIIVNCVHSIG